MNENFTSISWWVTSPLSMVICDCFGGNETNEISRVGEEGAHESTAGGQLDQAVAIRLTLFAGCSLRTDAWAPVCECVRVVCVCVCGPVCKVHLSPSVSSLKVLDGWNVGCVTACVCGSVCPDGMDVRVCKVWTCVSTYWVCKVMCPCVLEIVGCVRSASQLSVCRSGRVCNPSGVYDLVGGCEKNHSSNWVCKQLDGCGWVSNHLHSKHECVSV